MSMNLKEIAIAYCNKQPHQIDSVLEGAPLLARFPFEATTNGLMHFFEKVKSVDAAGFVDIDGALPIADVDTEIDSRTLGILGFKIKGGVDTVRLTTKGAGFAAYLARKAPKVMRASGMKMEQRIAQLAKIYAARNGNIINAGGSGSGCFTIFAFRLLEGEMCGLYDPDGFGQGAFFETLMLNGGALYEDKDGKDVYGASYKSYIDIMMENPKCVGAIANIKENNLTRSMVDDLLASVRAGDVGDTIIVGSPYALQALYGLKNPFSTQSESISTKITSWNGVDILEDWNFPMGEDAMTSVTDTGTSKLVFSTAGDTTSKEARFFSSTALAAGDAITSQEINLGKGGVLSKIAVRVNAASALTGISGDQTLKIEIQQKVSSSWKSIYTTELTAAAAAGENLVDYTLPESFTGTARVVITAGTGITGSVDAYGLLVG